MDAILLIIESSLNQYNNAAKYIWYEMVSGYGYEIAILWYEMAMVRNGYGTKWLASVGNMYKNMSG